jgi:L-asparaginase / beta-aspartyl-peptidase
VAIDWAIALHGGAGPIPGRDYAPEEAHLTALVTEAGRHLAAGASALETVHAAVAVMEASGLYLAGRGAQANTAGAYELDAAIMDGASRRAGAVGALQGIVSPVAAARLVMERTPNVLIVGAAAQRLMLAAGLEPVTDPATYYRPSAETTVQAYAPMIGTVGAVARDRDGRLAAATSTAGIGAKTPGRLGDTPLIGAGTWADDTAAVSCTGLGEYFIRANVAADVSARMRYGGASLEAAAAAALATMKSLGGEGGLIAVSADGTITLPFNSGGMKRAMTDATGRVFTATFA